MTLYKQKATFKRDQRFSSLKGLMSSQLFPWFLLHFLYSQLNELFDNFEDDSKFKLVHQHLLLLSFCYKRKKKIVLCASHWWELKIKNFPFTLQMSKANAKLILESVVTFFLINHTRDLYIVVITPCLPIFCQIIRLQQQ